MGIPVVVAARGGLPVVDATVSGLGLPATVAINGFGTPVTLATFGTPMVFSPPLGPAPPIPAITLAPMISDVTPTAGESLTCSQGTWTNSPTGYSYQWYYWTMDILGEPSGTLIPGATSAGYGPLT